MAKPQRKPAAAPQTRELVRRPTVMAAAMLAMLAAQGIATDNVRIPQKREPTWRVSRKG